ncbi:MAG: CapA family protein [Actinobacteria bacterium]|nr:CapA family protein [Actinomycetota bacterium]
MGKGRHSSGTPKQPPLMRWVIAGLAVFVVGGVSGIYLPGGGAPTISASSPTPSQGPGSPPFEPTPAPQSVDQVSAYPSPITASASSLVSLPSALPGTRVTIVGVGDILVHKEIWAEAQQDADYDGSDFTQMLAGVAPRISAADLGVCHMEYPFAPPEGPVSYWPALPAAPWSLATGVAKTGFDTCSTVSNHIQDKGLNGIKQLLDALDMNGIAHTGSARSEEESRVITMLNVKGVKIAHLAYSYGLYENGDSWSVNPNDADRIVVDAQRARDEGAQIVIVSLHDGEEDMTQPDESQLAITQALAAAGTVDLVLGHHTHCVQPVQKIGDMWVAFGHGNLLTAQSRKNPRSGDGLVTQWTFQADSSGRWRVIDAAGIPILNQDFPFRLIDLSALGGVRNQTEEDSWQRTLTAVMSMGADKDGFRLLAS